MLPTKVASTCGGEKEFGFNGKTQKLYRKLQETRVTRIKCRK